MRTHTTPPHDGPRVRPVTPEDSVALRELRLEALRLHPIALTSDLAEAEARPAESWSELCARAGGGGGEVVFVADSGGGALAGMAGVFTMKTPKLAHVGTVWGVYVRDDFRGRGVGDALVRACIQWARAKGLVTLRLSVVERNEAAVRCYERCGFVRQGVEPMAVSGKGSSTTRRSCGCDCKDAPVNNITVPPSLPA